ncbi:MAG: 30S ribosomal protein S17 [Bryobacterales bacterium]|nr:30S ribosomal protein S17 [Bryobacterales bacterium]
MSEDKAISRRNEKVGEVVSTKMAKTIVVEVTRRVAHPLYRRVVTRRKRFYAHDEDGTARLGDTVRISESRPLSRLKKWRLAEVLRRAAQVSVEPENVGDLPPLTGGQSEA